MVGMDESRTYWRVLKIDRLEPSVLNICEDSTTYTERECSDLLTRVHEGNKPTGGLTFVTTCYGIVGFVKFLGPYYMLLITERQQIGAICGHTVYAISKSEMIALPNSVVRSKNEDRYKKLLCMVDLTKDFFFSYSYHVMRSLQKNTCENERGQVLYETMFVWNEFLTRGIRNLLQNTLWTVALVYGFFKQAALSISGLDFTLTLIARRSRHYAGTRYLKRGVNEMGRVANDVEIEQIVYEDVPEGFPDQISSVVQNRGSIPLFWSQETSRLNIKPDITVSKRDPTYEATRLHFKNLVDRYGKPIIILNLIKMHEKRPRESILRTEFANAIDTINKDLSEENHLKFLHWDLHKHSRSKATNVLLTLGKFAECTLTLTSLFYCQVTPPVRSERCLKWPDLDTKYTSLIAKLAMNMRSRNVVETDMSPPTDCKIDHVKHCEKRNDAADNLETLLSGSNNVADENYSVKPLMFQKGVLRTNCIDCLDRTNVAQYAFGLVALKQQLHALGVKDFTKVGFDDPLGKEVMSYYETMGDTLAHQYGGSAAHNKIFSERRGQWKATTQSQELLRTFQRYLNNAYMDADKQNAINVFLGHFQPEQGKPEVWELDSDQDHNASRNGQPNIYGNGRSCFIRSLSDGNILHKSSSPMPTTNINKDFSNSDFSDRTQGGNKLLCESTPEISTCESDLTFSRSDNTSNFGWLIRSVDRWSASMMVLMMILQVFVSISLMIDASFGVIGYSLPQDQIGYCAVKSLRDVPKAIPVIGLPLIELLRGSACVGQSTLTHFYSLHTFVLHYCCFLLPYTPLMPRKELFVDMQRGNHNGDAFDYSNFVDLDWLSSFGNSCEQELFDRSVLTNSQIAGLSSDNIVDEIVGETTPSTSGYGSSMKVSIFF
ncbi:hypothetical protein RJ640_009182 [Escallonia rubra]|uniref:SAC domain-containing protein n=1 Tax=Escallonia rubra TaxID=112253 RepID=A0AA88RND7_9ASTE|nr:hypothetical protein RJ640_009182 [Escallonia rubra]